VSLDQFGRRNEITESGMALNECGKINGWAGARRMSDLRELENWRIGGLEDWRIAV
jgi:hypothetical protein